MKVWRKLKIKSINRRKGVKKGIWYWNDYYFLYIGKKISNL